MPNTIYFGDNLPILTNMPDASVDLIYIDPPFNTGRTQARTQIKTQRVQADPDAADGAPGGDRTGFAGRRYETIKIGSQAYTDAFDDYLAFLEPRLRQAWGDGQQKHFVRWPLHFLAGFPTRPA